MVKQWQISLVAIKKNHRERLMNKNNSLINTTSELPFEINAKLMRWVETTKWFENGPRAFLRSCNGSKLNETRTIILYIHSKKNREKAMYLQIPMLRPKTK